MACMRSWTASSEEPIEGANPPSSPTFTASCPYLDLITDLSSWYTSHPIWSAWRNDVAPVGIIMNSCMGSMLPACEPPLITLRVGTGRTNLSVRFPARAAMCA
eukprot:Amastigsp_a3406_21.p6 type:complete len:103 gc:universal Amastigsp_a3406_21:648-956(+)